MPNYTKAYQTLWPNNSKIAVRTAFLYVGQGDSTILFIRNGTDYKVILVDINLDCKNGGIDVPRLVKDLLEGKALHAFLNTHPHEDHLCGIGELTNKVAIDNVWHSGFSPGRNANPGYDDLKVLIAKVRKEKGENAVRQLRGSRDPENIFDVEMHVLAPAEHVVEDIKEEDPDKRRALIHENCIVVKFGKHNGWILLTGDADKPAFENNITKYHSNRLPSQILSASHHGSRSFFKNKEDDEPYLDSLKAINPSAVVISAPTQQESKHGHPDADAMELYKKHVGTDNVYHVGAERYSYLVDIMDDGSITEVKNDEGKLSAEYGLDEENDGDDGGGRSSGPFVRPKSPTGDSAPRKFG
jgi:beta-lactamase superfamily II metal-dependent hydrolase